jgi:hypothetical protein
MFSNEAIVNHILVGDDEILSLEMAALRESL